MEAHAGAEEQLRLVERPQHHAELRAAHPGVGVSGIVGVVDRIDLGVVIIAAPAQGGPEPVGPVERVFGRMKTQRRLNNLTVRHRLKVTVHSLIPVIVTQAMALAFPGAPRNCVG